jgi:hypothetical protein
MIVPQALLALVVACPAFATSASTQFIGQITLDRTSYTSPSGELELVVTPTERGGGGPGAYRLTRAGVALWSGVRPYTLWEAAVTDDGLVAGYAYG